MVRYGTSEKFKFSPILFMHRANELSKELSKFKGYRYSSIANTIHLNRMIYTFLTGNDPWRFDGHKI
jgi:hypothetical protein